MIRKEGKYPNTELSIQKCWSIMEKTKIRLAWNNTLEYRQERCNITEYKLIRIEYIHNGISKEETKTERRVQRCIYSLTEMEVKLILFLQIIFKINTLKRNLKIKWKH